MGLSTLPLRLLAVSAPLMVATLVVLAPTDAAADRLPGPKDTDVSHLPLRLQKTVLQMDPMRRARTWPVQPVEEVPEEETTEGEDGEKADKAPKFLVPGRDGKGPWRLFEGVFNESPCRAPVLGRKGGIALALCSGLDVSRPSDEHIVLIQETVLSRYRKPAAPVRGGPRADLSRDGRYFALVVDEGGGRAVHVADLEERTDTQVSGGWRNPGNPQLAPDGSAVAFTAEVGRDNAVVLVNFEDNKAHLVWRSRSDVNVHGVANRGHSTLITAKASDRTQIYLVDVTRATAINLAHRKSAVESAVLHPSAEAAAFSARVGGVCAAYWGDVNGRRRTEFLTSLESCFEVLGLDDSRRNVLVQTGSDARASYQVYDRRARGPRYEVLRGCKDPTISGDGQLMAVHCPKARMGSGIYLFAIPPPKE